MENHDRSHRQSRKAALCGMMAAMYALILRLFRLEAVAEEFAGYSTAMVPALLVLGNITFLVLDQGTGQVGRRLSEKLAMALAALTAIGARMDSGGQTGPEQRPARLGEKLHHDLHPGRIEQCCP